MLQATPDALDISTFSPQSASDAQVEAVAQLMLDQQAEQKSGDPVPSRAELVRRIRSPHLAGFDSLWALASRSSEPLAFGCWDIQADDNPDILWLEVYVRPDHRRRGIGSLVSESLLADTRSHAPALITVWFYVHVPVGRQLERFFEDELGLAAKYTERISQLALSSLDSEELAAQLARRLDMIGDRYSHEFFEMDDLPPRDAGFDLDDFVAMSGTIRNLMPLDDLSEQPETYSVEKWRSAIEREKARGRTIWNYVILDLERNRSVGVTNVCFNPADPRMVYQWDTGVLESYQNRGLGKALKLLMLDRVISELPGAELVETENAESNAAMLAINDSLGFRECRAAKAYEIPIGRFRRFLGEVTSRKTH